jgi:molecular chaperone GrpE
MTDTKQDKHVQKAPTDEMKKMKEEIGNLKKELDVVQKDADEYRQKYLRSLADYQNFEKRIIVQKEELTLNANKQLIIKLLSFLDNMDKAEMFVKDEHLKMVKDSFYKLLSNEGLKELDVQGKEFDPYTAEAIDIVEGKTDGLVVEIFRKGYELNGKVIRVAQVRVTKKKIT